MTPHHTIGPPEFLWTADALVERHRSRSFIYGRWDRLFGCWQITDHRVGLGAFMPRWPLLDRAGGLSLRDTPVVVSEEWDEMFLQEKSYFHEAEIEAHWSYDVPIDDTATPAIDAAAEDTFRRYIDLIPIRIRRVVAAFGSWQWVALSMVRETPVFEEFLANELSGIGPGFVASCLALSSADTLTRSNRRTLCHQIMFDKRVDVVRRFAADCRPTAAIKCLSKLQVDSLGRDFFVECINLLRDPEKAKIIDHQPALTPTTIRLLSRLPSWACSILLLRRLVESSDHVRELAIDLLADLDRLVELWPRDIKTSIASSLKRSEDGAHLVDIVLGWRHRIAERAPFPSAPIPKTGHLSPLTSVKMIEREALRMRNCIADYISHVLSGTHYFYQWNGAEPATVCLQRDAFGEWRLGESAGIGNRRLSPDTCDRIANVVGAALVGHTGY